MLKYQHINVRNDCLRTVICIPKCIGLSSQHTNIVSKRLIIIVDSCETVDIQPPIDLRFMQNHTYWPYFLNVCCESKVSKYIYEVFECVIYDLNTHINSFDSCVEFLTD